MIHLLTGGARSGKSRRALDLALEVPGAIDFVATAEAGDVDMAERIRRHREERGSRFRTTEAPLALCAALRGLAPGGAVIVDCLTLWCTNLLLAGAESGSIEASTLDLCASLVATGRPVFVVTNEVGLGVVPENALARRFRDELGRVNQRVAHVATRVTFMVSGLPLSVR